MRGLHNFIQEFIESNGDARNEIVASEIIKIKKVFLGKKTKIYEKKKSIAKLCFMVLMGYDIKIGVSQTFDLLQSPAFSDRWR